MAVTNNIATLQQEMDWLAAVIDQVVKSYFVQEGHEQDWLDIAPPDLAHNDAAYALATQRWGVDRYARLALALAMAPHLRPDVLDVFFGKNQLYDRGFTEFGGLVDKSHSGFLPTVQTFVFLVTATHPHLLHEAMAAIDNQAPWVQEEALLLGATEPGIPQQAGLLGFGKKWFHYFVTGQELAEEQSADFPAQLITTALDWEDVVLDGLVREQVAEIQAWLQHGHTLMAEWGLHKKIKPGYRALFYGPPGTGKTLTASLLGKKSGRPVYRIDLSLIVSKYIGETEKNLGRIFHLARHKNWILFFDEADALFGKRTAANSSNDRFANQQTAYLLQLVEDFPGVVILASNLLANMDEAFARRFQSTVHFTMPGPEERYQLWQHAFSGTCTLHPDIDLYHLAEEYELAGGAIINVLRHCALAAIARHDTVVTKHELMQGIRREFKKEHKTISMTI